MSKRPMPVEDASDEISGGSKRPRTPLDDGLRLPVRVPAQKRYTNQDYTICWICALVTEYVAAQALLDETHQQPTVSRHDEGDYILGKFGRHNVVLAVMPGGEYGKSSATATAKDLRNTFPNIRFGLMVGIGGGAPTPSNDIRLGDVVVSLPEDERGGVLQYDFGKTIQNQAFRTTGYLNQPPRLLRSALNGLRSHYLMHGHKFNNTIEDALKRIPRLEAKYKRPDPTSDRLYQSDFLHPAHNGASCLDVCGADPRTLVRRFDRSKDEDDPAIHYGLIASADTLMKDAKIRDKLAADKKVLCFEMEAAGIMNNLPCLVIRGICDYADTHKNKDWQGYAAMTAAAYAKDLLERISPRDVESLHSTRGDAPDTLQVSNRESTIDQENMRLLLNSLRFDTINTRQESIKDAHGKTCEWLLGTDQYLDWLNSNKLEEHRGFLWIKGKPGAGKSTLINYVYIKALGSQTENTAVVSFFFNARGETLEKTMIGMYRSLLLQLLEKFPKLQAMISLPGPATPGGDYRWTIELLQLLFKQAILGLGDSSAVCFIDALDECDEDEVRGMVAFVEQLSQTAVTSGIDFRVCFASRYYPNISIARGLTLELERQAGHSNDIIAYIETELKIDDGPVADEIRSELRQKASGVFMWACLVIGILNTTCDRGRYHELQQKLREIPGTLHALFRDMLTRDEYNKNELLLCIQWVLFARRPLSPWELYFAILSGTAADVISQWKSGTIPPGAIVKFLIDASKGLVELTTSDTPRVQFIHESVKDFLIRDNGLGEICYSTSQDFLARSHEQLMKCCHRYIGADAVAVLVDDKSVTKTTFRQAGKVRESRNEEFPFLDYALQNILYHADRAAEDLDQRSFLQSFPRQKWLQLVNIYRHTSDRYQNASLLYVLAEQDCGNLIKYHSNNLACFEIEHERYFTPIFASLGTESHSATRSLLQAITENQPLSSAKYDLCEQYDRAGISIPASKLEAFFFRRKAPRHARTLPFELGDELIMMAFLIATNYSCIKDEDNDPLLWAVDRDFGRLINVLLDNGADPMTADIYRQTRLHRAVRSGEETVVTLLLENGADIEGLDISGHTPLQVALAESRVAEKSPGAMVELLLDKGANTKVLDAKDNENLFNAIWCGQEALVKELLENGADLETSEESDTWYYKTPLHLALSREEVKVAKLLLDHGADIEQRNGRGFTPLHAALHCGKQAAMELLLEYGAEIEALHPYSGTPLTRAVWRGESSIVKLLLEHGADIEAIDPYSGTPLIGAVGRGESSIVKLLLEHGADIKKVNFEGETPLHVAVRMRREAAVKLLLQNGAEIDEVDHRGLSPLLCATMEVDIEASRLAIKYGADLSCTTPDGFMPLAIAAQLGNVKLVELLLRSGADPSMATVGGGTTPLRIATARHHDRVVRLLRQALDAKEQAGRDPAVPTEALHRIVIDLTDVE